eukprot:1146057-Pelagomonas_calceolata.AAC.4
MATKWERFNVSIAARHPSAIIFAYLEADPLPEPSKMTAVLEFLRHNSFTHSYANTAALSMAARPGEYGVPPGQASTLAAQFCS